MRHSADIKIFTHQNLNKEESNDILKAVWSSLTNDAEYSETDSMLISKDSSAFGRVLIRDTQIPQLGKTIGFSLQIRDERLCSDIEQLKRKLVDTLERVGITYYEAHINILTSESVYRLELRL